MADPFISQIYMFACSYAIQDFVLCNGTQISVNQNQALFSLIGYQFGPSQTNVSFSVPNLCGRAPIGWGTSSLSGTSYLWGYYGGAERSTTVPLHTHAATYSPTAVPVGVEALGVSIPVNTDTTTTNNASPQDSFISCFKGNSGKPVTAYAPRSTADACLAAPVISGTGYVSVIPYGDSNGVSNMSPYVTLTYIICTTGIYPVRP